MLELPSCLNYFLAISVLPLGITIMVRFELWFCLYICSLYAHILWKTVQICIEHFKYWIMSIHPMMKKNPIIHSSSHSWDYYVGNTTGLNISTTFKIRVLSLCWRLMSSGIKHSVHGISIAIHVHLYCSIATKMSWWLKVLFVTSLSCSRHFGHDQVILSSLSETEIRQI